MTDILHEECGVVGVYNAENASQLAYLGLHALQHRGQEGAGIAAADGSSVRCRKGFGLLAEALSAADLSELSGRNAIGHVRYATAGGREMENVQPLLARAQIGTIAAAHNGQIVNANVLRGELEQQGSIFHCTSDSEIILHLIQRGSGSLLDKIAHACRRMDGAFSFVLITEKNLYAVRDKNGLRPLCLGKLPDGGVCAASESCALDAMGAELVRDVRPGEIVKCSAAGLESVFYTDASRCRLCAMEYIYFSRPDSVLEDVSVHTARKLCGRMLALQDEREGLRADMVVGVPDSSLSAALGYSLQSGLPNELGLVKNRYVGRTFIAPTQQLRDRGVQMKLAANRAVVAGKRIVLLDDSIVRGTTSRRIVRLLRQAGAAEVHMRIAAPQILYPCFYGVDTSQRQELISAQMDERSLCEYLGADSLRFMRVEDLCSACGSPSLCLACFTGRYPTALYNVSST